ncbi:MAG: Pilus assembly protein PilO [Actinomycetota bacterium]|nr:Pilus assembly protein PilO [Actinomycetota bacterium]
MQVKTKNFMVGALVVLLVAALWYRVVYSPMESKASKAKTAAHDADAQAKSLRAQIDGTSRGSKAKTTDPDAAVMHEAIPDDAAEASFLRSMDALLVSTGVTWQSVTPTAPVVAGSLSTITVSVTVQGTQDQVKAFVSGLGGLKRLFVVDNISLSPGGSKSAAGSGTAQGQPGKVFVGDQVQASIAGRIFSQATAVATPSTVPTTGSSGATKAPASGATSPPGVQNN